MFLAMGKARSALPDLTRAIQLKPDFLPVRRLLNSLKIKTLVFVLNLVFHPVASRFVFSGPAAERKHPLEAGKRTRGQRGL